MHNIHTIKKILDASAELHIKIENFKLKQLKKDDLLVIEKSKLIIILDNCFKLIKNILIFVDNKLSLRKNLMYIFKMVKFSITNILNKLINQKQLIAKSKLLENRVDEHQKFIEMTVKENHEIKNDISKINFSLNKILESSSSSLENKISENLGHNSTSRVDFYQEENVRLGSELLDTKKKFEILKNEIEKYEEQRSNLITKINSVNDALNDTNVLTNVFDNSVKSKINILDHNKITNKNNLDINEEVANIFSKNS